MTLLPTQLDVPLTPEEFFKDKLDFKKFSLNMFKNKLDPDCMVYIHDQWVFQKKGILGIVKNNILNIKNSFKLFEKWDGIKYKLLDTKPFNAYTPAQQVAILYDYYLFKQSNAFQPIYAIDAFPEQRLLGKRVAFGNRYEELFNQL